MLKEITLCPKCLKPFKSAEGWSNWFGIIPLSTKCKHCGFKGGAVKIDRKALSKTKP